MKTYLKRILISWDILVAIGLSIIVGFIMPKEISTQMAFEVYNMGISVLSIVFSVYFAALAIIISFSDDDFVEFLEEHQDYTAILWNFKFSLLLLLAALVFSMILFGATSYAISEGVQRQNTLILCLFIFIGFYGLFAASNTTLDAITYSKYRAKYMLITKGKHKVNDINK